MVTADRDVMTDDCHIGHNRLCARGKDFEFILQLLQKNQQKCEAKSMQEQISINFS